MQQIKRPGAVDISLILFIALIWGSAFVAIKLVVADIGPLWAAAGRVLLGFFVLLPIAAVIRIELPTNVRTWLLIGGVAALNMVIPFLLISWGIQFIEAGVTSLLLGATPFIAMIMGHFLTPDERITPLKILSVAFGISGVALLFGPGALSSVGPQQILAQLSIILSGACYVSAGYAMRRVDMSPLAFTVLALGVGSIALTFVAFAVEGLPKNTLSPNGLMALIWLGAVPTGLAYLLRFYLVRKVGVSIFSLGMNTIPVFGLIFGAVILDEVVAFGTLAALGLVICGLLIARLATPPTTPSKSEEKPV